MLLASVVALDGADKGTISTTADNLKRAFGINNTDIGLLLAASGLIGALFTIPVGALADRVRRTALLAASVATWAIAMFFSGLSQSFVWLIASRVALGALTATAGPTVASLTGDFIPAKERGRMYGYILAGEYVGTGFALVISGYLASHLTWRYAFWWLLIPSAALAYFVFRLEEPARGGQSPLRPGQESVHAEGEFADQPERRFQHEEQQTVQPSRRGVAEMVADAESVDPYAEQVLTEDPAGKSLWWAVKYILRVRTNVVIIVASSLAYFYLSGFRPFAVIFAEGHFGISKSATSALILVIGIGALVGVFVGGRLTDRLLNRGILTARVIVPAAVLLSAPFLIVPAFYLRSLWIAVPLMMGAAALLSSADPPQDAGRLDVIHPHLWGRSEGVRTAVRGVLDAAAPVTFGLVSDHLFGGHVHYGVTHTARSATGLSYTFSLFLVVLIASGLIVLVARRTYPRDVATADLSTRNTLGKHPGGQDVT